MEKQELLALRKQVEDSVLYKQGQEVLRDLANLAEVRSSGLNVVVDLSPAFLVSGQEYGEYRGCTLEQISEFEDCFSFDGKIVSRSCLLSFVVNLLKHRAKEGSGDPMLYLSLGTYARVETDIVPGVRETVFPQLEAEILTRDVFPSSMYLDLLFLLQEQIFKNMGLKGEVRVRINNHNEFVKLISILPYVDQYKVRQLMDKLETERAEGRDITKACSAIFALLPAKLHTQFDLWARSAYQVHPQYPRALWSPTLVGGPLIYADEVFETDYTTTTGVQFTEVAGGGNFTPLAQRFGLMPGWKAVGFAAGLLRLGTAKQLENNS